jgi:hypothetical protein
MKVPKQKMRNPDANTREVLFEKFKPLRKFRAIWTPEAQQDLQAYYAIDFKAELTQILAQEIDNEIYHRGNT